MTSKRDRATTKNRIRQSANRLAAQLRHPEPTILEERDLIVPAKEAGGLSEMLSVRIRQGDSKRTMMLAERGQYAELFDTKSEVIRAALHLGLCVMEGAKIRSGVFTAVKAIDKLVEMHMEIQAFEEMIKKVEVVVGHYLNTEAYGEIRAVVLELKRKIADMPPDSRERYGKIVDRKFGMHLSRGMASIVPGEMDEGNDEVDSGVEDEKSDLEKELGEWDNE